MRVVAVDHYENFPVASWLCPPAIRSHVVAIYRFARTADDIADEGDASSSDRLADLSAYRADLFAIAGGREPSPRWRHVFMPLRDTLAERQLPLDQLDRLLRAFEQDARGTLYENRAELLDYCKLSANPVGRLMLHLYGLDDATALAESDSICTALQLANFWQDLGVDLRRGRYYVPSTDCERHGLLPPWQWDGRDSAATQRLVSELAAWARTIMLQGAPLVHRLAGRAGWELRLVVQGGLRILDKVHQLGGATIATRPVLRGTDAPRLLWRALRMQRPAPSAAATTTR